ncbi:NADH:ubiquinone reductase (Na(+)-transporting) subunit A, partial [Xanthomonas citri pv. citri]|nr:NADH:ubiquinone reductase (Na(+)-transporting) subunit A [Xanthomonas citri pv. citri]
SKVPALDAIPSSIFVNAMDTNPLAADPEVVLKEYETDFKDGLTVLTRLFNGQKPVYLCKDADSNIPLSPAIEGITIKSFSGVHPAGLVGTHIHFVDPVGATKQVWHLNYQDVIAIGKLFTTGELFTDRIIS